MLGQTCKTPIGFDDDQGMLASMVGEIQASLNRQPGPAACWGAAIGLSLRGVVARRSRRSIENVPSTRGAAA
jgi:hypothetical protein